MKKLDWYTLVMGAVLILVISMLPLQHLVRYMVREELKETLSRVQKQGQDLTRLQGKLDVLEALVEDVASRQAKTSAVRKSSTGTPTIILDDFRMSGAPPVQLWGFCASSDPMGCHDYRIGCATTDLRGCGIKFPTVQ